MTMLFYKMKRLSSIIAMLLAIATRRISGRVDELPAVISERATALGGIYIKFLQLLALKPAYYSEEDFLEQNPYDMVPFEPIDIQKIIRQLKDPKLSLDDYQPIAAGSFAQVYAAHYDNAPVIIKILRPSVERYLSFDQKLIKLLTRLVANFSRHKDYPLVAVIDEFIKTTKQETNYLLEVDKSQAVKQSFVSYPSIVIPKTYRSLCRKNIIVQERITGIPLTHFIGKKLTQYEHSVLVERLTELGEATLLATLEDKLTHADPHPGNLFLVENGQKLALIDFGIAGEAPQNKPAFYKLICAYDAYYNGTFSFHMFFEALFQFYSNDLYDALQQTDRYMQTHQLEKVFEHAEHIYEKRRNDPDVRYYMKTGRLRELFMNIINEQNALGFEIRLDGGVMQAGAGTFSRLLDALNLKQEVLASSYNRAVMYVEQNGMPSLKPLPTLDAEQVARSLEHWIERIATSDPLLFSSLKTFAKG